MYRVRRFFSRPELFFRISSPSPRVSTPNSVRHVQFKRPWIRRFVTTGFFYGAAFHLWSSIILLQLDDEPHTTEPSENPSNNQRSNVNQRKNGRDDQEDTLEGEEDLGSLFLPLGLPYLRKGEFYAGSDPEWKNFVEISKDHERLQNLRGELASIVLKHASESSVLSRLLGGPLALSGFWLVHNFPHSAPPEYHRPGLEITDTAVSWISKPMSLEDGLMLRRCIQPLYMALAIGDACSVLLRKQLYRFNISSSAQGEDSRLSPHNRTLAPDYSGADGLNQVPQTETRVSHPSHLENSSHGGDESRLHPSIIISALQRLPLPRCGPGSDLHAASLAFKWRMKDCLSREPHAPRRGAFYFSGPVGVKGPRGVCRIEVKAEYDPIAAKWSIVSTQLRDLNLLHQKPLGGR